MKEGDVDAVMGAYNRVYGESASASQFLLRDILRQRLGLQGLRDVRLLGRSATSGRATRSSPPPEEAAALAVKNGTELECGSTYAKSLPVAVAQGPDRRS